MEFHTACHSALIADLPGLKVFIDLSVKWQKKAFARIQSMKEIDLFY